MDINELIERFNEGELDVEGYFNDYETFFNILKKRGVMSQVDPEAPNSEEWQNKYLIWLYSNDKEKFNLYVEKFLGDVEIVNGTLYLILDSQGELAKLFCTGHRNNIDQDTVESILSGEYEMDYYYDSTDDVYRDVVQELTKENLKRLKEYIVESLKGQQIPTHTEVLESIAKSQGNDYTTVDETNIDEIVDDEETMNELMKDELGELKSELYTVHSSAYNTAYEDDLYDSIWSKLEEFFQGPGEWFSRPHTYKKDTQVQKFKVPIHNFYSNILEYLYLNKLGLDYHGSYVGILDDGQECLSVYAPDYPDSRKVDKNINSYFSDYI